MEFWSLDRLSTAVSDGLGLGFVFVWITGVTMLNLGGDQADDEGW